MNLDDLKGKAEDAMKKAEGLANNETVKNIVNQGKAAIEKGKEWLDSEQGKEMIEKGKDMLESAKDKLKDLKGGK